MTVMMTDGATLRKARIVNSKLMKRNLTLLMSIRETESEIRRLWKQLQLYHREMDALGISIPPSCQLPATVESKDLPSNNIENRERTNAAHVMKQTVMSPKKEILSPRSGATASDAPAVTSNVPETQTTGEDDGNSDDSDSSSDTSSEED